MLSSIYNDLKAEFSYGNKVNQLVIINVAVFVIAIILNFILFLSNGGKTSTIFESLIKYLAMSSDGMFVLTHPWILITNMFLHLEFFHILWNMLIFIWFGRVTGDFLGNHRIHSFASSTLSRRDSGSADTAGREAVCGSPETNRHTLPSRGALRGPAGRRR